ncbi:hypothetical protein NFI96_003883 [Prochilodus magdalenae]|nr:hypothetical protein NFI96_003883 [Prochilodus magdalenae]
MLTIINKFISKSSWIRAWASQSQSRSQKMTSFQFKSCFVFLLSITFTVSVTLYVVDIRNVAKQIYSYYESVEGQRARNDVRLNLPPRPRNKHLIKQWTPGAMQTNTVADTLKVESMTPIRFHKAHPHNYRYIIDEPRKCAEEDPFLALMVPVAPQQVEARNAIRQTWGNDSKVQGKTVTVIFMVGLPGFESEKQQEQLRLESQMHHDIVQANFADSYHNLTIKTMMIMDWLATHCTQAAYAMKVDSDMFLNVENLMNMLLGPDIPRENYITGRLMWNRPVVRTLSSKWYVSKESYPEDYYPVYLLGMGYVFSNDLSGRIVEVSKSIKPFSIEDAYVGECLKHLGIEPSHPPDLSQFRVYGGTYVREEYARVITTILGSPKELIRIWKDLKSPIVKSWTEKTNG